MAKMKTIYPKRIQERIHGVHSDKVQVGYEKSEERHKEGDTWTDENGKQWEKKNGIVRSIPKFTDVRVPLFCPKCEKPMGKKAKDTEVYYKFGFCLDCLIERDGKMIADGTMDEYVKKYVGDKQRGYYTETKIEIEEYLRSLNKKDIEFVNQEGKIEKWSVGDVDKLKEFWEKELEFINKELEKLGEQ